VAAGVTLTAVPLVTEMLPGVMTPLPLENTPVRLADPPASTVAGLATKLAMKGEILASGWLNEAEHPVRPQIPGTSTTNHAARWRDFLMEASAHWKMQATESHRQWDLPRELPITSVCRSRARLNEGRGRAGWRAFAIRHRRFRPQPLLNLSHLHW
jgi:hypothetical protein